MNQKKIFYIAFIFQALQTTAWSDVATSAPIEGPPPLGGTAFPPPPMSEGLPPPGGTVFPPPPMSEGPPPPSETTSSPSASTDKKKLGEKKKVVFPKYHPCNPKNPFRRNAFADSAYYCPKRWCITTAA